jgi:nucleoside-diphosphate-sugar epimerase
MIILVGRTGNLSLALQKEFRGHKIRVIGSEIANKWTVEGGHKQIKSDLEELSLKPNLILNAAGLINPTTHPSRLFNVNYQLPKNLDIYATGNGIKLVTFGSVTENLENLSRSNPYLLSKRMYFEYLLNKELHSAPSLHMQIHTWYGVPSYRPHMFLGQMLSALEKKSIFEMSSGLQLREYHHIDDDVNVFQDLLRRDASGIFEISHGETLSLKEIATAIFDAFDSRELLKIGALKTSEFEVTEKKFERPEWLNKAIFRKTCSGIIADFMRLL